MIFIYFDNTKLTAIRIKWKR